MRLLDRYLLRELLIPLFYCLGGFLIFYIAFDLIGSLNKYQEKKLLFSDVVELYVVKIPEILVFILPIVLLLALLYALTNHARHHEITAIRAAGVSLWRLCLPYLAVGFILSLALFAMNELLVPDSVDRVTEILNRRKDKPAEVAAEGQIELSFDNRRDGRFWTGKYNLHTHAISAPKVHWKLSDGTDRIVIADHADYLNDKWTFFSSPWFSMTDITNATGLAAKLKKPARNDALSQYLSSQLSPTTHYLLFNSEEHTNIDLPKILAEDLNHITQMGPLYDEKRFAGVKLSADVSALLDAGLQGTNLIWLNRNLLFDAYPREMNKGRSFGVIVYKSLSNSPPSPILYTNMLAIAEFSETPEQFKRDFEFNNRFHGSAIAQSADIPVLEIKDYLRYHPNLDSKRKWYLTTQLYGRLAAPWTCVVVVLIAIPFGAASGRRNIFVGVAGSIVICFAYFVLLKLGLALGTGGYLPGWLAAWLPNATFGLTGFWMMLRVR